MHVCAYVCLFMNVRVSMHAYVCVFMYVCVCMHAYLCVFMHACMHLHMTVSLQPLNCTVFGVSDIHVHISC
jgi:hypothetical protein